MSRVCGRLKWRRRRRRAALACLGAFVVAVCWLLPSVLLELARISGGHDYPSYLLRAGVSTAPAWLMPLEPAGANCTGLLVVKTRRSGSTWLYELLNRQRRTYMMYELHVKGMGLPVHERERALAAALGRCHRGYSVAGYTLDVSGMGAGLQLARVVGTARKRQQQYASASGVTAAAGPINLLLYARTNLVKHAVALIRDELFGIRCGHANKVGTEHCDVPATMEYHPGEIMTKLLEVVGMDLSVMADALIIQQQQHWQGQQPEGLVATAAAVYEPPPTRWLYYENLQADPQKEIRSVFEWLGRADLLLTGTAGSSGHDGPPEDDGKGVVVHAVDAARVHAAGWAARSGVVKHTAEDLRTVISNFEEVAAAIDELSLPCLSLMLRASSAEVFPGFLDCAAGVNERLGSSMSSTKAVHLKHGGSRPKFSTPRGKGKSHHAAGR